MTDRIDREKLQAAGDGVLFGDKTETARASARPLRPAPAAAHLEEEASVDLAATGRGLSVPRRFTTEGVHPFDAIAWELRSASIVTDKGETLFRQDNCEIPANWTQLATNVVVSKYFRGGMGTPDREHSVRQLVGRVADTITDWGRKDGYFAGERDAETFRAELTHLLVNQLASFNSPVWFNVGVEKRPQCSACFINSVEDSMDSHPRPGQDRGHALQVRQRHRHQPVDPALEPRAAVRRRPGLRPGLLHARLRRLRRRHQVRRQDPPRRQDGHPQRRPSRHRGIHRLQGERGEEGLGPDRRRLRRLLRRRGLQLDLLPEQQQLGPRQQRVHAGGRGGRRLDHPRRRPTVGPWTPTRPAT